MKPGGASASAAVAAAAPARGDGGGVKPGGYGDRGGGDPPRAPAGFPFGPAAPARPPLRSVRAAERDARPLLAAGAFPSPAVTSHDLRRFFAFAGGAAGPGGKAAGGLLLSLSGGRARRVSLRRRGIAHGKSRGGARRSARLRSLRLPLTRGAAPEDALNLLLAPHERVDAAAEVRVLALERAQGAGGRGAIGRGPGGAATPRQRGVGVVPAGPTLRKRKE